MKSPVAKGEYGWDMSTSHFGRDVEEDEEVVEEEKVAVDDATTGTLDKDKSSCMMVLFLTIPIKNMLTEQRNRTVSTN